ADHPAYSFDLLAAENQRQGMPYPYMRKVTVNRSPGLSTEARRYVARGVAHCAREGVQRQRLGIVFIDERRRLPDERRCHQLTMRHFYRPDDELLAKPGEYIATGHYATRIGCRPAVAGYVRDNRDG